MNLRIDPADPVPIYRQIIEEIRRLIALGALKPGDRLPAVRELATASRVNRNTAARAIQELEREGVVRSRVGQGTFVAEGGPKPDRSRRNALLDRQLDRVVITAITHHEPLDELPARLGRRIDRFRKRQAPTPKPSRADRKTS